MPFQTFIDPPELPPELRNAALAIGNFDGVHRGHRAVIDAARALAKNGPALALTFEPHPVQIFRPDVAMFRLTPAAMKARLLAETGLDGMITLSFSRAFAAITAEEFLEELVVKRFGAHSIAVGYDFHFGKDRRGTPEFLVRHGQSLGLDIAIVAPLRDGDKPVSSSAIRAALGEGAITEANRLLGREWSVLGTVIHGEKLGRELGFPTANIALEPGNGLRYGIYAVRVRHDGKLYGGVASYGRRPTFDNGAPLLETVLFDFSGDLYGQELEIIFVDFIRSELKFDTVAALVERMNEDARIARTLTLPDTTA